MRTKEVTYEYGNGTTKTRIRIFANEGKVVTNDNGVTYYNCVDVDDLTGWVEINNPELEEDIPNSEIIQALEGML